MSQKAIIDKLKKEIDKQENTMEVKDKKGFCYYLYVFFSISIFAWLLEILYSLIFRSKLVSPGVLIGPWCPIYGTCGLLFFIFTN